MIIQVYSNSMIFSWFSMISRACGNPDIIYLPVMVSMKKKKEFTFLTNYDGK